MNDKESINIFTKSFLNENSKKNFKENRNFCCFKKMDLVTIQTRKADEITTLFYVCGICGNKIKQ